MVIIGVEEPPPPLGQARMKARPQQLLCRGMMACMRHWGERPSIQPPTLIASCHVLCLTMARLLLLRHPNCPSHLARIVRRSLSPSTSSQPPTKTVKRGQGMVSGTKRRREGCRIAKCVRFFADFVKKYKFSMYMECCCVKRKSNAKLCSSSINGIMQHMT